MSKAPSPLKGTFSEVRGLRARLNRVRAEVYSHGDGRFSECLADSPAALRRKHADLLDRLERAEQLAVSSGRAYRASTGGLIFYGHPSIG